MLPGKAFTKSVSMPKEIIVEPDAYIMPHEAISMAYIKQISHP
jgi:hypothetical protein